ncbi:hypothetical protein [Methanosarcina mazei]|uniref:Uncharacterized protein n=1 Tax=Methanosarcina mazei TaxID=2209 RepID=A0A0F8DPW8_METMZ|nr:hypothetical protein [Methanosarcina mazei]KKF97849.1 hypothetical protein DU47_19825 [Methanosarcina mazei]KKH82265.1 hypothetical protein DU80_04840 [Methanosarcina mazei]
MEKIKKGSLNQKELSGKRFNNPEKSRDITDVNRKYINRKHMSWKLMNRKNISRIYELKTYESETNE